MPTAEEIDEMKIADIRLSFSDLMETIVTTYGDDKDLETSREEDKENQTACQNTRLEYEAGIFIAISNQPVFYISSVI